MFITYGGTWLLNTSEPLHNQSNSQPPYYETIEKKNDTTLESLATVQGSWFALFIATLL
jgi:hypothetical protein